MTDANGVTVSNGYADNNAPYDVATATIDGKRFQKVIPCDASGTPTSGLTQDVNLAEVGGAVTSLGQKNKSASIPVVIATEQDTVKDGGASAAWIHGTGVWDGFNEIWYPTPCGPTGVPITTIAYDSGGNQSFLQTRTTDPSVGDTGVVVRNLPSGEQDISYAAPTSTTGNITAIAQTVVVALAGKNSVAFSIRGTYGSVAIIFEASLDGTNWGSIQACRLDSNTIETASGTISNTARAWEASVNNMHSFRVRSTAWTSGTAAIQINASYSATEPIPAIASHAVTLTSTTLTSVVPGTAATSLGKAIDSIPGATDTGVACLVQRSDSPGAITPANGDYTLLRVNNLGQLWAAAVQSGSWAVSLIGAKTSGATPYNNIDVNATGVLVQAGQTFLSGISAFNTTGAVIYLKFYNKATAASSADTPVLVYPLPIGESNNPSSVIGFNFSLGVSIRCTTGVAYADNTSPAANGCIVSLGYT